MMAFITAAAFCITHLQILWPKLLEGQGAKGGVPAIHKHPKLSVAGMLQNDSKYELCIIATFSARSYLKPARPQHLQGCLHRLTLAAAQLIAYRY